MGAIISRKKKGDNNAEDDAEGDPNDFDEEAVDAAKYALAIQREDYTTYIELIIQCQHLPKLDLFSQSDPMVVVYLLEEGIFKEIGKTEVQSDNPNPKFSTAVTAPYNFEKKQLLKFEVYDVDELKDKDELDKQELIGFIEITIHEIVCSPEQSVSKKLIHPKDKNKKVGTIMVKGVEKDQSSHKVCFRIGLRGLNTKSMYALQLSTPSGVVGNDITLRTTEFHLNSGKKGFEWEPFMVMSNKIPDEKTVLKFELIERKDDKNNFIGEAEINFGNVLDQPGKTIKIMKSGYVLGTFKVVECKKVIKHSFLNYVYAGTEISLIMAVDFTNSNGDSGNDNCFHNLNDDGDNLYIQAIRNIGGILQYYDTDSLIPIYGFGAKLPPYYNVVSHCFALNSNYFNPEVEGLGEVLNTYKKAVKSLKFHGPTAFSEVINLAVRFAESTPIDEESQKYYLLMIITDGDISDFEATKDQLVRASELPISVIIVGVGDEETEFKKMEELDGDEFPVFSKMYNKEWDRDIVQFVKLSDFKKDGVYNIEEMALATLEEIPKQFLEFMQTHNIEPIKNVSKSARTTGQDYLFQKLEDKKRNRKAERKGPPTFLVNQRNDFFNKLVTLEFDPELILQILEDGIPAPDINLFLEYVSLNKTVDLFPQDEINNMMPLMEGQINSVRQHSPAKKKNNIKVTNFRVGPKRELESIKARFKAENYKLTQQILESKDKAEIDYKVKTVGQKFVASKKLKEDEDEDNIEKIHHDYVPLEQRDVNEHYKDLTKNRAQVSTDKEVCIKCRTNFIDIIFRPCGHAAVCKNCKPKPPVCPICKQNIVSFAKSDMIGVS